MHRRLRGWEPYDRVTVDLVHAESAGEVGSEWSSGVVVTLLFKFHVIVEEFYNSYPYAIANLTALLASRSMPIEERVLEVERACCDQPGCSARYTVRLQLKRLYSEQGELLATDEAFHDDNYIAMEPMRS